MCVRGYTKITQREQYGVCQGRVSATGENPSMADTPFRPPDPPMVKPVRPTVRPQQPDIAANAGSPPVVPPAVRPTSTHSVPTSGRTQPPVAPPAAPPVRPTRSTLPVTPQQVQTPSPAWYPTATPTATGIYAYTRAVPPGSPSPCSTVPYTAPLYEPTLVVQNITCRFARSNFTLHIPDLRIYPAEITYIAGPSGSGKSTLMKMLTLETRPDSGAITILGRNVAALTSDQRDDFRGGGITYIPQTHLGLMDGITPVETIARLLLDYDGIDLATGAALAEVALNRAGLGADRFRTRIKKLSGGERARVAIAKAYAAERPLCLADEILPALDQDLRLKILDLFQDLAEDGFAVVIIAHQPDMMNRFHRVIELENGHIKSDVRNAPVVRGPKAPGS